jgi:hypothetical protein
MLNMKIYLIDTKRWLRVNYVEARKILSSGLNRNQWTTKNINKTIQNN